MAVVINGDVQPVGPNGFGVPDPTKAAIDGDGDNIVDWIEAGGNSIFTSLINPNDPDDSDAGAGVRWNNSDVWRDYDTPSPIHVGKYGAGDLIVNGGSALRYQTLTIGEQGHGRVVVTGAGSRYNNDPRLIDAGYAKAIRMGEAPDSSTKWDLPITRFADHISTAGSAYNLTTRSHSDRFNAIVGVAGHGELMAANGGVIEICNRLLVANKPVTPDNVAGQSLGTGRVIAVGEGSRVSVTGYDLSGVQDSIVGAGGRVEIYNDATITIGLDLPPVDAATATSGETATPGLLSSTYPALVMQPGSLLLLSTGFLTARGGVVLDGACEISGGASVVAGNFTIGETGARLDAADGTTELSTMRGTLIVNEGASVTFTGPVVNDGLIVAGPGSRIEFSGGYSGDGQIVRNKCGVPSVILGLGEIETDEEQVLVAEVV